MTCPVCSRGARWENNPWRPFCSERCQVVDLGRWAAESYRVPGQSFTVTPSALDPDLLNDAAGDLP